MAQLNAKSGLLLGVKHVAGPPSKFGAQSVSFWGWDDGDGWDGFGDADGWDGDGWDGWDGDY